MIAIVDYGMGNLRSVQKAFEKIGAQAMITHMPTDIVRAHKVVLPGVGAMAPAMQKMHELGLDDAVRKVIKDGRPFMGICLGLQLLFDSSSEGGFTEGLKIIKGKVERFKIGKVPHMGWNQVQVQTAGAGMYAGVEDQSNMYFCHSYYVAPMDSSIIASTTNYGSDYASAIASGNVWGIQFHPEKSQAAGLKILENFTKL